MNSVSKTKHPSIFKTLKVLNKIRKNRQERLNAKVGSYLRFGPVKFNDVNLEVNKNALDGKSFVNLDAQDQLRLNEKFSSFNYQKSAFYLVR